MAEEISKVRRTAIKTIAVSYNEVVDGVPTSSYNVKEKGDICLAFERRISFEVTADVQRLVNGVSRLAN